MIRTPLRPLATILRARRKGENPDEIEKVNIRARHEIIRDKARRRAEGRLLILGLCFFVAFGGIGLRMGQLSASEPVEPRRYSAVNQISSYRADIVDRQGRILATNLQTRALYAQPPLMIDRERAAQELVRIFPDLDLAKLTKQFTGSRKFIWIKKKISPEQMQLVHEIGDPGLLFAPREMRIYPNGAMAAHILGGARFGEESVSAAEVIGVAGIEKMLDEQMRNPDQIKPIQLSLDLSVQAAARDSLWGGMKLMNAKGASSVLMDVHTGEVISMVSLPDFDPNARPRALTKGDQSDSPMFNRAVQGLYELGSVFKIFTAAQGMELGLVNPNTMINTLGPIRSGGFKINDFHPYGKELSVTDVIVKSSNLGSARIAIQIGAKRQKDFMRRLGLLDSTVVELVEGHGAKPLWPSNWSELSTMTISYGHGISTSPLQLAAAYSSIVNGGTIVKPTLLRRDASQTGRRIISAQTSKNAVEMLRQVVLRGTAKRYGNVAGYNVGGKTGTADKPKPSGGYYDNKVIATFASVFPSNDPKYVLIVTLDEPVDLTGPKPRRTAGWTAVPVAAEMIERLAPLLGLRPEVKSRDVTTPILVRN